MTDRLKGLTVTFEKDMRDDDAEGLIDAIKRLRGVADVIPHIVNSDDYMNRTQVRYDMQAKLYKCLQNEQ